MDGTPQMPSSPASDTRLTVDDLLLRPDDGKRHELIDGVHYVSASPSTRHQAISGRLFLSLGNFLVAHPALGRVFYAPLDVVFTRWDLVVPDLLVIAADQLDILTAKNVQGPPAIAIEILSPRTRKVDEQIKRRLFERGDVREYWVADPELELVKVYRRAADGAFPRVAELTRESGDTLTTPILPGWSLALDAVFTDAL
ncbi:MAG: Uma2 family endonuclease [Vicinamibacterales bacterium]